MYTKVFLRDGEMVCEKETLRRSEYFAILLNSEFSDSYAPEISSVSYRYFSILYTFMCLRPISLSVSDSHEIYKLGVYFQVCHQVQDCILSEVPLSEKNVLKWIQISNLNDHVDFKKRLQEYFIGNFNVLNSMYDLRDLGVSLLSLLDSVLLYEIDESSYTDITDLMYSVFGVDSCFALLNAVRNYYLSESSYLKEVPADMQYDFKDLSITDTDYTIEVGFLYDNWEIRMRRVDYYYLGVFARLVAPANRMLKMRSLFYRYAMDNSFKEGLLAFPIDWKHSYGPANFAELAELTQISIWVAECPLHSFVLSQIYYGFSSLVDVEPRVLLKVSPTDIFSLFELVRVSDKDDDASAYFLAQFLVHHDDEATKCLVKQLRYHTISTNVLQIIYDLPWFLALPKKFVKAITIEIESRETPYKIPPSVNTYRRRY